MEKIVSQEDIDSYQAMRTIHDAELLIGGAVIRNGQLYPTSEQLEALAGENKQNTPYAPLEISQIEMYKGSADTHSYTLDIEPTVDNILKPYQAMVKEKLPAGHTFKKRKDGKIAKLSMATLLSANSP